MRRGRKAAGIRLIGLAALCLSFHGANIEPFFYMAKCFLIFSVLFYMIARSCVDAMRGERLPTGGMRMAEAGGRYDLVMIEVSKKSWKYVIFFVTSHH